MLPSEVTTAGTRTNALIMLLSSHQYDHVSYYNDQCPLPLRLKSHSVLGPFHTGNFYFKI